MTATAKITAQRHHAKELHARLGYASLEEAYRMGMNLSRWLEGEDPSDAYQDGLDAFERQLKVAGIRTSSDPERGFYANPFEDFFASEATRVLMVEWIARQYRKISQASRHNRSILASDASAVGSAMRPYVTAAQERYAAMAPAIPVAELIATTTRINTDAYRALYLNDDGNEYQMVRVGQNAEIPRSRLTEGEHAVTLYKYGRGLEISYEASRRRPIDSIAFYIAQMAVKAEVDKVETILDVLINGDGNSGTAAVVYALTTLDPAATAGRLTLAGWLAFKLKFANPYKLTHELVQESVVLQQLLLDTGSANHMLRDLSGAFGGFEPINQRFRDNVRFGVLTGAPSQQVVAFDAGRAIEQVQEIGGTINETKKWAERQTDALFFTEVEGYAVIDGNAARILNINA